MQVSNYKVERVKRALKQTQVSEKTGISQPRLSEIERGVFPKPEEKQRLDKFYEKN